MTKNKTVKNQGNAQEFLKNVEIEQRRSDALKLFELMNRVIPEEPKMWGNSIIGYGQYHYKYDSGREGDFFKVGFSPRKQNMVVYIMPSFDRFSQIMDELGNYKTGKSCLYIKKLSDVDFKQLEELIVSAYQYMTGKYG